MLDICLLGTGGMLPLPYRYLTSLMVRYNGSNILIDCGEGTQNSIRIKLHQLDAFLADGLHVVTLQRLVIAGVSEGIKHGTHSHTLLHLLTQNVEGQIGNGVGSGTAGGRDFGQL